jgi:hypothetical protein
MKNSGVLALKMKFFLNFDSQIANCGLKPIKMRKHNGMRPQDIIILLKIVSLGGDSWQNKDLARLLYISSSEITESLNRSALAGLLDSNDRKSVYKQSLLEFIEHGLHYVFPVTIGGMENGIYTAHSHPVLHKYFKNEFEYIWPYAKGKVRGLMIEPLYDKMVPAALEDGKLYAMAALLDIVRVGRVREWKIAMEELKKMIE